MNSILAKFFSKAWLRGLSLVSLGMVLVNGGLAATAFGQQVTVGTPVQVLNDSFYENFGVNWGFNRSRPGGLGFFNSGGNRALPPFGGFDPNSQATLGFRGNRFSFNFFGGAGSSRSIVSETPFVTIPNGGYGVLSSASLRPFVTGVVPVVGDRPATVLDERLQRLRAEGAFPAVASESADHAASDHPSAAQNPSRVVVPGTRSSAEEAAMSVAEIRWQHAAEDAAQADEIAQLIQRGKTAEASGKPNVARIYYEQAARRADGELRQQLDAKIAELRR